MTLEEFYETDWFKERPEEIQDGLKLKPVNKVWYLKVPGEDPVYYGVRIMGMDDYTDKPATYRIHVDGIMPPVTERSVFGIRAKDLLDESELPENADILYITKPVMDIT